MNCGLFHEYEKTGSRLMLLSSPNPKTDDILVARNEREDLKTLSVGLRTSGPADYLTGVMAFEKRQARLLF